jgi:hypothetical protein
VIEATTSRKYNCTTSSPSRGPSLVTAQLMAMGWAALAPAGAMARSA